MGGLTGCARAALRYETDKPRGLFSEETGRRGSTTAGIRALATLHMAWQDTKLSQQSSCAVCTPPISSWQGGATCSMPIVILLILDAATPAAKLCSGSRHIKKINIKRRIFLYTTNQVKVIFLCGLAFVGFVNRVAEAGHTLRTFATVAPVGLTATEPRPDTL